MAIMHTYTQLFPGERPLADNEFNARQRVRGKNSASRWYIPLSFLTPFLVLPSPSCSALQLL